MLPCHGPHEFHGTASVGVHNANVTEDFAPSGSSLLQVLKMLVVLWQAGKEVIGRRDGAKFLGHDILNRKLVQCKVKASEASKNDDFPRNIDTVEVIPRVRFLDKEN